MSLITINDYQQLVMRLESVPVERQTKHKNCFSIRPTNKAQKLVFYKTNQQNTKIGFQIPVIQTPQRLSVPHSPRQTGGNHLLPLVMCLNKDQPLKIQKLI